MRGTEILSIRWWWRIKSKRDEGRTQVDISKLNRAARIEGLARMLTGAEITDTARRLAKQLLKINS